MTRIFYFFTFPVLSFAQFIDRPNVIIFMADDMGVGDCSAYQFFTKNTDDQQIHTPAMESLANMGMLFTDAHTPSSLGALTHYSVLTGRYPWRSRMKHWLPQSSQGDPLIEESRPTLATLFRSQSYATAFVGIWHLGLRYSQSNERPAAGWENADLTKDLFDGPCDHGFDFARFSSPSLYSLGKRKKINDTEKENKDSTLYFPVQSLGPGHIHNRKIIFANDLYPSGTPYSDHAIEFLNKHIRDPESSFDPFFLYYASHSHQKPSISSKTIDKVKARGTGKTISGQPVSNHLNHAYEYDVALGRLLDYLKTTKDPRRPSKKLIDNTVVIFTSDNGAANPSKTATGPLRSNKGSCYEGGHRVPYIVSWPMGEIGHKNLDNSYGKSDQLIGLHDLYATFSAILGVDLPDLRSGKIGAEDSLNQLPIWQGNKTINRPMFYNDHKEGKNPAECAMRFDNPTVEGKTMPGKWKLFFDESLIRFGNAIPVELFELSSDPMESKNSINDESLVPLVKKLISIAFLHRNCGGHRLADFAPKKRITFDWTKPMPAPPPLTLSISGKGGLPQQNKDGLGIQGNLSTRIDSGEGIALRFEQDVLLESIALRAGNGSCGGSFIKAGNAPLAIYCIDADNNPHNQNGIMSDLGIIKKGKRLILNASPHLGVESSGSWKIESLTVRPFTQN